MTRWLGCTALAAVLAVGLAASADEAARGQAAKAFAQIQADFDKDFDAADGDDAKRKAAVERFSPKFLDHAKKNAADDTAPLALTAVLQMHSVKDKVKDREEAAELLGKSYVKNKSIKPVLRALAVLGNGVSGDPASLAIVKAVAKDNPDKLTRAAALEELANSYEFRARTAENWLRNEKLRERNEKRYGEDFVRRFVDSADEAKDEADRLRRTLAADYGDVVAKKDDGPKGGLSVGAKAPETVCVDIDGKPVKLADLAGKVVVLDFWATWCGPCRAMIPHTRELVKGMEKKPFVFVSVSCDDERETLENFTRKTDMPWSHWWDGRGGKVARAYEVRAFPTIYVVDHKGVIQFKSEGFDKRLDSVVEKLVKEAEASPKK